MPARSVFPACGDGGSIISPSVIYTHIKRHPWTAEVSTAIRDAWKGADLMNADPTVSSCWRLMKRRVR